MYNSWRQRPNDRRHRAAPNDASIFPGPDRGSGARLGSNLVPSFADARLLDNGDAGYGTSGRWSTVTGTGYQSVVQSIACTSCGDSFASWQFDNLSPWLTYQVYATWVSGPDRNAQAG